MGGYGPKFGCAGRARLWTRMEMEVQVCLTMLTVMVGCEILEGERGPGGWAVWAKMFGTKNTIWLGIFWTLVAFCTWASGKMGGAFSRARFRWAESGAARLLL